ncbi:AAA family ATPase [Clostridium massiliamazoniense]|uniref:AAA family ATPase n=1 Tax=Clostridium massiliamazoniense TaxID=1347366 RepID=UPI0006D8326C|nr:AAA family ATPase [Clostridium massiliamazoniense]
MGRELTPREIVYDESFAIERSELGDLDSVLEQEEILNIIEEALNINRAGFNIYLVDSFSNKKLENLIKHVKEVFNRREKPRDICYVTLEDPRKPTIITLENGFGIKMYETLEKIKTAYFDKIFDFYNSSINDEKERIIEDINKKRNDYIGDLIKTAKNDGFELKVTNVGISFVPIKDEESEDEGDIDTILEDENSMFEKVGKLKLGAEEILDILRDMEDTSLDKLRGILSSYLNEEMEDIKEEIMEVFEGNTEAKEYLLKVCEDIEYNLIDAYSMNYEDDEEKIKEIILKYIVNVLLDNSNVESPKVIFEEDPSVNNLIGSIEYENHNGSYSTDVSLIKAGSLIEANEGCLILRLSSLLINQGSYYYLRRALLNEKVNFSYDRGYLELLSLNGLKPEAVPINVKVILIGDYESYDYLYKNDDDFKRIFQVRAEVSNFTRIDRYTKEALNSLISNITSKDDILSISPEGINEIGKYLSRLSENRKRILWDIDEVERIIVLSNTIAKKARKEVITDEDIRKVLYNKSAIEKEYEKMYRDNKILINVTDKIVGSINGLAVIDTGYLSFGKPIRITCIAYKGSGRIIDTQRESNLSGVIHGKSISILKGFLSNYLNSYGTIPIDFHISFEQMYGPLEGDSASVAEIIALISALSKIPINQNIAVTGSLNQFGEVQPIGGVNEKIEGFFKVSNILDTYKGKGVIIPYSNKDELILSKEVEEAVRQGDFKIYTMKNIYDAMEVLMLNQNSSLEDIAAAIDREIKKYK